jgi:hypothetical protein
MRKYSIFLTTPVGSFGSARDVWLLDDEAALVVGKSLLKLATGVDIWRENKRVALLSIANEMQSFSGRPEEGA